MQIKTNDEFQSFINNEYISYNDYKYGPNNIDSYFSKIEKQNTKKEDLLSYYVSNGLLSFIEAIKIIDKIETIKNEELDMKNFNNDFKFYKPQKPSWYDGMITKDRTSFREFMKIEYLDFLDIYLKENLIVKKELIIEEFIEQIYNMITYNIPIKEENFKLKNYNFYLNLANMSDIYKLPKERVNLFLDMFEQNPLEAIAFIKNRRKVSQKEIENFLEKIK